MKLPMKTTMQRVGLRLQRRNFPYEIEKQGKEYIVRLNWKASKAQNGVIYQGSVVPGTMKYTIGGSIHYPYAGPGKKLLEKGKACFDANREKWNRMGFSLIRISISKATKTSISFYGWYSVEGRERLSSKDLDIWNDFLQQTFRCFQ